MQRPFGRGITPVRGLTNHSHSCQLLTIWDDPPTSSLVVENWQFTIPKTSIHSE